MDEKTGTNTDTAAPAVTYTPTDIVKSDDACEYFGVAWTRETVNREIGGNASGTVIATDDAQILAIVDLDKFRANMPNGDEIVLGIANGTSLRVMSQDVSRRNPSKDRAWKRTTVVNRLLGIRNAGVRVVKTVTVTVEKNVNRLPNGEIYAGGDLVEFQQLWVSQLVEQGVPFATAQTIALQQKL